MMKSYFSSRPGTPWHRLALAALLSGSSLAAYAAGGPPAKPAHPTVANDAAVTTIYTYGRLATPRALPHAVQAVITNNGTDFITSLPVTLTVTGSNSFTNTQTVSVLAAGASTTVTFAPYPTTFTTGSNTLTVTVPADDNNANNSAAQVQRMTTGRVSYIDTTATLNSVGASVGSAGGQLAVKYTLLTSTAYLTGAVATFAGVSAAATYQVLVYDASGANGAPGTVLYTSAVRTRTTAASSVTVPLPSVQVGSSFFIALKELDNPLGVATQNESPLRPNVFYTQASGGSWTAVTAQTRRALDVIVGPAPTCPAPTAISVTSNAANSAVVSFTAATGGTQYTVVYVPSGTLPTSTSPSVTGSTSPITIPGLTANTRYDIYITTSCGTTSTSAQLGPFQVTTACRTLTFPYTENFDGVTAPTLPCGITVQDVNNDGKTWTTNTGASASAPNSMRYEYSGTNAANDWFYTPGLTLVAGKSYQVQFKYRANSASFIEQLEVKAGTAATASAQTTTLYTNTNIVNTTFATTTAGSNAGQVMLFTPPSPGTYYFGFHAISAVDRFYLFVDDLVITEMDSPNCPAPTSVVVTNPTTTGATISFGTASSSSSYTIYYGPTGFTPGGAGSTSVLVTTSPYTLTGLTAATTYQVYVQANCTAGGVSLLSAPTTFASACRAYVLPYSENFDSVTAPALPCGITVLDVNNDGATWTTNTTAPNSAPNSMRYIYSGSNAANDWFFTPGLPMVVGKSYRLQFKYRGQGTLTEAMEVKVGNTNTPAGQTTTLFTNSSFNSDTYITPTTGSGTNQVMLFTPTAAGTYFFGFHAISIANQWYIYVDDLTVEEIDTPNCAAPTNVVVSNPTVNSATVTFTPSAGSSGYTLFYGPRGFLPGGTGSSNVSVGSSPYNLTGLTPNTSYDVYLRANCTAGGVSLTSAVASFTTACAAVSTFPYTETFDGVTAPALPCGITVLDVNLDGNRWTNSTTTPSSAPNSMRYTTSTSNTADDWFFTQALNLQGGVTYQLKFKYRSSSTTLAEVLEVKAGTGLTAAGQTTTLFSSSTIINTTYVTTTTGTTSGQVAPFTPTISATYYIGFHVISPANRGSLNVDDVEVTATGTVACPSPSNIQVSAITATTAQVTFTAPTNGVSYQVIYGPSGFNPATGGQTVTGNSPVTISGLTFSTIYDVYVRATCSGTAGTSTLAGPTTFTTACAPATMPYAEGFDAVTAPALACNITVLDANNDNSTWVNAAENPASSPNAMRYQFNPVNTADDWFFSAGLPLTAGTRYQLQFKYRARNASSPERLEVKAGTATTAAGQTTTLFTNNNIVNPNYVTTTGGTGAGQVAPFVPATTGIYYFGFHAISTIDGFTLYVDDLSVAQALSTKSNAAPGFSAVASPVPFGDRLSVDLSTLQAGAVQLTLHDAVGRVVSESTTSVSAGASSLAVPGVSALPAGMYLLTVRQGSNAQVIRVAHE